VEGSGFAASVRPVELVKYAHAGDFLAELLEPYGTVYVTVPPPKTPAKRQSCASPAPVPCASA
jgi:hypothetical protein